MALLCNSNSKTGKHKKAYRERFSEMQLGRYCSFPKYFIYLKILNSFVCNLPEFLYWGLLLPCDNHMSRVVDGEEENVPVAAEPGDEEWTRERLEGQLNYLSGTHPGGRDTQHHQQTTQHLQSCVGTCLIGPALFAGLTARCLCLRL